MPLLDQGSSGAVGTAWLRTTLQRCCSCVRRFPSVTGGTIGLILFPSPFPLGADLRAYRALQ